MSLTATLETLGIREIKPDPEVVPKRNQISEMRAELFTLLDGAEALDSLGVRNIPSLLENRLNALRAEIARFNVPDGFPEVDVSGIPQASVFGITQPSFPPPLHIGVLGQNLNPRLNQIDTQTGGIRTIAELPNVMHSRINDGAAFTQVVNAQGFMVGVRAEIPVPPRNVLDRAEVFADAVGRENIQWHVAWKPTWIESGIYQAPVGDPAMIAGVAGRFYLIGTWGDDVPEVQEFIVPKALA